MTSEKIYDDLLYPILCSEGNIIGFFDRIFEFLYRRTDYFKIKKDRSSNMGLEKGEAENIVRSVFCKYMEQAMNQHKLQVENTSEPMYLDYIAEEVVSTTGSDSCEDTSSKTVLSSEAEAKSRDASHADEADQQSDPKIPWMDPDCYNGAKYEDYSWAQTIKDIDVRIKVPKHVTSGKQAKVDIYQSSINVELLSDGKWNTLKKGEIIWKINVEESTWTLVPGEHIHICLQKLQERWWDSFFVGEPKIDMKSIDPSMAYEDLDEESQAKINELMYNEHQKRLGQPTIQQNKIQHILKEAWNSEGSPFKGQPFDPSIVNIQSSDSL